MITIKFTKHSGSLWKAGDLAGFDEAEAKRFVERGVAEYADPKKVAKPEGAIKEVETPKVATKKVKK